MSGGILRFPWTSQPQSPVGVDWSNPLTRGLVFLANYGESGSSGRNLVSGLRGTQIGTPAGKAAGPQGVSTDWTNGGTATSEIFTRTDGLSPSVGVTVGYFGRRTASPVSYCRPIAVTHSSGTLPPYISYGVGINDAGSGADFVSASIGTGASGYLASTPVSAPTSLTQPHVLLGAWDTTSNLISVYHNDKLLQTKATTGSLVYSSAATGPLIVSGSHPSTVANNFCGDIYCAFIWNRKLSASEVKSLYNNPWQLFAPIQRTIWVPAAAGGGVSGTLATTNANDTSAATGTTTVTGTLAKTNANDSSSASGTTTVTGTLARTNANDTSAASGTTTVTGTLAKTNANDSVSASGDVGGNITGTVNYTNANDTSAASGTTTVTGSLAKTNANDSASASGTTTVTGSLARTNANDSVVASGAAGTVTGTVNVTNDNDTSSASGTAGNPFIASQGGGGWLPQTRRKSRKQIYEERVKLGILPPPVIKAAAKVAAVAQTVEEFKEERPKYEEMFLKAIKKTEWLPDYTRAIQAQLAIIELEEEELLLLL